MLKSFLKQVFQVRIDPIIEGVSADQYNEQTQDQIRREYFQRWAPPSQQITPESHPWLFDPCEPPQGWSYDPFYEMWVKLSD
jgi:hypothetical protein